MAADTARTATMAMVMATAAFAAAERPLWGASQSEELLFKESFCGTETEDVLSWETPALRVDVFNVLPSVLNCI
jgi:hypothetical protein